MGVLAGLDVGGTKCAVSLGRLSGSDIELIAKESFPTPPGPADTIAAFVRTLDDMLRLHGGGRLAAIGISCGGPLDSRSGLVLSPPNLPNWDRIDIVSPFRERYGVPVGLQNDANACALAEWKWGAGKGCSNMIFLTFGTGMGSGLILDGRLYSGTNDMAGEVGHIRMEEDGPVGYGKAGSFEGFCSGGGIARLAAAMAAQKLERGEAPAFCRTQEELAGITAQSVSAAAGQGDPLALEVFEIVGRQLGRGLALLIDILNPQRIVIGSIYGRQQALLEPIVMEELKKQSLPLSLSVCQIVPAGLKEHVGDYAGLSVALNELNA
ncbi:ROK family protein [Paenibacillus thalictri]|uniref:ROK family protein n=1 Tax=Paenibacillus thalictri TaxID=2527873 RepID=A0A4Q9DWB0_9BACL|nr:ROK family protein [Paenibacillus thalictri]TBL79441.1 ROK family protein [Paenibacillus thalictri]